MKYKTTDELEHFEFQDACIAEMRVSNGVFTMLLDNVKILPENSCNRDIRKMRTNQLLFRISEAAVETFVEEGYQVYDADGNIMRREADRPVAPEQYGEIFKELEGCVLYAVEKKDGAYEISIDTEDHTFFLRVAGESDTEEWERFMNLEEAF